MVDVDEMAQQGVAKLGYFDGNKYSNADNVFVLVINYTFEDDIDHIRIGNKEDLKRLYQTFSVQRNCNYKEWRSPKRDDLLQALSTESGILQLANTREIPSVLVLFLLSHGQANGQILTDTKEDGLYQFITTREVIESLGKIDSLRDCLKLFFFGPCRGEIDDLVQYRSDTTAKKPNGSEAVNGEFCKILNLPKLQNFVIIYSTVEMTRSRRSEETGTWLVKATCDQLDQLEDDAPLEILLTDTQYSIELMASIIGQTPEINYFKYRKFTVSKCTVPKYYEFASDASGCCRNVVPREKLKFYPWQTDTGEDLRRKWAAVLYESFSDDVQNAEKSLRAELEFETCLCKISIANLNGLSLQASGEQNDVGCILVCCFAPLVIDNKEEICVRVDGNSIPIGLIVKKFIGPTNKKWIGRPKIFFFVNQTTCHDNISMKQMMDFQLSGTNCSGWFVQILPKEDLGCHLVELLKNLKGQKNETFQELAIELLRTAQEDGTMKSQITSTLSRKLNFPNWPTNFVRPKFSITRKVQMENNEWQNFQAQDVGFDALMKSCIREYLAENYSVWIVSAPPGMGKSTLLKEVSCVFRRELEDKAIFRILLLDEYEFFDDSNPLTAEAVLKNSQELFLANDVTKIIDEKKTVVLLDGFDEVCPDLSEKILALVREMARMKLPLWVATRPQEEQAILKALEKVPTTKVEINHFGKEEQLQILTNTSGKSEQDCTLILEKFEKVGALDILQNPFHLTLISKYLMTETFENFNLFDIYKKVVEKKLREALIQKESMDGGGKKFNAILQKRIKLLQKFALQYLNQSDVEYSEDECLNINNSGIATIRSNNSARLVHQTFAEFLVAQDLISQIIENGDSKIEIFANNSAFRQSRVFVDAFFSTLICPDSNTMSYLKSQLNQSMLEMVVGEGLKNVFKIIKPYIHLENSDETELFQLLDLACRSSEEIGLELLEMNASTYLVEDRTDKLRSLVQGITGRNFCRLLAKLLEQCPDLQDVIKMHRTLSCIAAERCYPEMLQLLLENGSPKDSKRSGKSALHLAIVGGYIDCVRALVKNGVDLSKTEAVGNKMTIVLSPLQMAASNPSVEICRHLVENGADTKAVLALGHWNALHLACVCGQEENAKYFAELIDVNSTTKNGRTPLHLTAEGGFLSISQLLFDMGARLRSTDSDGWNALHYAARYGSLETVKFLTDLDAGLIKEVTKHNFTALHLALCNPDQSIFKFLLQNGADAKIRNQDGWNVFHRSCYDGNLNLTKHLLETNKDLATSKSTDGRTGLHLAAENGHDRVVQALIARDDVDILAKDKHGHTALDLAVHFDRADCARLLKEASQTAGSMTNSSPEKSNFDCPNSDVSRTRYMLSLFALRGYLNAVRK